MPSTSPYLDGTIGQTVSPTAFPPANRRIDDRRYSYEGNWCFCRFDSDEVYAARFGFGRGAFDARDYGAAAATDRSFLMLHLELMTRDGASLWIGSGKYDAKLVQLDPAAEEMRLASGNREIFRITGWPAMRWRMASDDGHAAVDLSFDVAGASVLPDAVLPNNLFAMWVAWGRIAGEVTLGGRSTRVSGSVFYDHPRINIVEHPDAPPFGFFLYTPQHFADGSMLTAYDTFDRGGRRIDDYSFGLFIDPRGRTTWLPRTQTTSLRSDADDKPARWTQRWQTEGLTIDLKASVRPTPILRAWGGDAVPQTRRATGNIPLVFDSTATIRDAAGERMVTGGGMAECITYPGIVPGVA